MRDYYIWYSFILTTCFLEILTATNFDRYMDKGGSTRPWAVFLADKTGIEKPYVVKLFSEKDTVEQHPVLKEVLGCVLAKMFAIEAPGFCLADFTDDFINLTLQEEQQDILKKRHNGLKFSTELLDGVIVFSHSVHPAYLKEYDFANLYAFDILLYNIDRGRVAEKPNILMRNGDYIVIDHELSLPFIDNVPQFFTKVMASLKGGELTYPYQQHLAYPYLRKLRQKDKTNLFDEFEENLRGLNIDIVSTHINRLVGLNVSCGHHKRILDYLYYLKNNPSHFCKIVQKTIL